MTTEGRTNTPILRLNFSGQKIEADFDRGERRNRPLCGGARYALGNESQLATGRNPTVQAKNVKPSVKLETMKSATGNLALAFHSYLHINAPRRVVLDLDRRVLPSADIAVAEINERRRHGKDAGARFGAEFDAQ
jgi:hypothetical protein